jgi:hypothetical protein
VRNRIEELKMLKQELVDAIVEAERQCRLLKEKGGKTVTDKVLVERFESPRFVGSPGSI